MLVLERSGGWMSQSGVSHWAARSMLVLLPLRKMLHLSFIICPASVDVL